MTSTSHHEILGARRCLSPLCAAEQAQHPQQLSSPDPCPTTGTAPPALALLGGSRMEPQLELPSRVQGHPGGSSGSGAVLQPVVPATGTLSAPVTLLYCSRDKMTNLIILTPVLSPSSSQFTSSPYALMEEQPAFF